MPTIQVEFESETELKNFMSWMDGQGEQDYWIWQECQNEKYSEIKYDYINNRIIIKEKK